MERIGLAPGSEIGGYTVVSPLGAGGMGTVYRAVDGGGRPVALKLLHPQDAPDETARARLLREVAALQRLRHPAVAAVLDAETDSTEAFLVTELVDGVDLDEKVREQGAFDAEALLALAAGLRDALQAVHGAGVVHRDLKPANVIVTDAGPVLIDFGLAQGETDARMTAVGLVAGTPGYLAPELLDGEEPGPSADWWGWAAVLAFAATGRPPFGTGRVTTVLARARAGRPDLVGLGRRTRAALRGALAPDPADRTSPDEVVATLTAVVAEGERMPRPRRPRAEAGGATGAPDDGGVVAEAAGPPDGGAAVAAEPTTVLEGADAVGTTALPAGAAALAGDGAAGAAAGEAGATVVLAGGAAVGAHGNGSAAGANRNGPAGPHGTTVLPTEPVPPATGAAAGPTGTTVLPTEPTTPPMGAPAPLPEAPAPTAVLPAGRGGTIQHGAEAHDGHTRTVPVGPRTGPPTIAPAPPDVDGYDDEDDRHDDGDWDDDPQYQAVGWIEDDLDASTGPAGEGSGYLRPAVPRRWLTQLALAGLVVAAGARRPGLTLIVAGTFFLVARAYGSAVEAMHGRRERRGVRRTDPWLTLLSSPWHLLRAIVGIVPSLLVAGSVVVIGVGVAWWFVGRGQWTIGDNVPGEELTGTTAGWLTGLAVLVAVLLVWFGPASRMTRVGTRRLLELVSPRRLGALVLVLVVLVAAVAIATRVLHGGPIVWSPLPTPTIPPP